uniref:Uncharacterized protein n=1 Tax=Chromera velia CCMP2878 TaxID=1169474 RepID=A0A0G4GG17_9ALVE|eukprot:Cvel_21733.t1-p1 / transcript=Cvel_21733.t1 / gene=Cvel_21733 / organism=Chromera_velia_CCMP2878 / gene_product=hypothetical protein / transcript_product=hypothetical protein / location=Cvel_scaffold2064:2373-6069(-) / protein_length=226 / sequence_SO=supercontig / SO=protein_coding / is_pseudo=false
MLHRVRFCRRSLRCSSREERRLYKNREVLEKSRLQQRTGNYFRHEHVENIIEPLESNPRYFLPESNRFVPTEEVAAYERQDMEEEQQRKKDFWESRRQTRLWRQHEREEVQKASERKAADPPRGPCAGMKNKSGAAYDIFTLKYEHSDEGRMIKFRDEMSKYRGQLRATTLAERSSCGFNPVTGEQAFHLAVPPPPKMEAADSHVPAAASQPPNGQPPSLSGTFPN